MHNPTIILHGIPNCDTVKKARTWLDAHAIAHTFYNFKNEGVNQATVQTWLKDNTWELLVNRKGMTWRALSEERKAAIIDIPSAIALMCEAPSVIKRPILTINITGAEQSHIGFSDALYQQIFKK